MTGDPCRVTADQLSAADDCRDGASAVVEGNAHRLCDRLVRDFCFVEPPGNGLDDLLSGALGDEDGGPYNQNIPCEERGSWPAFGAEPTVMVADDAAADGVNPATGRRVFRRARIKITNVQGSACARAHYLLARLNAPVPQASDTDEPRPAVATPRP